MSIEKVPCPKCGEVNRVARGWTVLFSGATWSCIVCGASLDPARPERADPISAGMTLVAYYMLTAMVFAALGIFATLLLLGWFFELEGRRVLGAVSAIAGAAFGVWTAEQSRRRREILQRKP